ncbi:hypothetical protein [Streptomyces sp. NPDC089919]|uniref:hypothetical protein n=1 Tax=Streptomyces sp. NPDC089919 TaxID=3155188 RepID=UPI00341E9685
MGGKQRDEARGMEKKQQEPGIGREEQVSDHPGPDPVHPQASRPVRGHSPEDLRRQQEQRMAEGGHRDPGQSGH